MTNNRSRFCEYDVHDRGSDGYTHVHIGKISSDGHFAEDRPQFNFREPIYNHLCDMGMDIQMRWELLDQLCPLDEEPVFDFRKLRRKRLYQMRTFCRNRTLAKQSYVALQYGINATIAMVVRAISTELDRRTKAYVIWAWIIRRAGKCWIRYAHWMKTRCSPSAD
jgi:hypothetical protein